MQVEDRPIHRDDSTCHSRKQVAYGIELRPVRSIKDYSSEFRFAQPPKTNFHNGEKLSHSTTDVLLNSKSMPKVYVTYALPNGVLLGK